MNNLELIQEAEQLLSQRGKLPLTGGQTVVEALYQNQLLTSYLLGRKATAASQESTIDRVQLFKLMDKHLSEEDVKNAMFDLSMDYETIPGDTKTAKIRELILHMQRRERLAELLTYCQREHTYANWPALKVSKPNELIPRLDTAIVVDIARPAVANVAQYLDEEQVEANFIVLRHAENRFLTAQDEWALMIQGFSAAMNQFSRRLVGSRAHFFLAGPGAMLFGLGCIWGTVSEAAVYHYENNRYYHVFDVSRELRR